MAKTKQKTKKPGNRVKPTKKRENAEKKPARKAVGATKERPEGGGKGKPGRPTKKTAKLLIEFCKRIADGKSMRTVCEDGDMPHRDTIMVWLATDAGFSDQYARASAERGWTLAEEAVEIADTPVVGVVKTDKMGKDGPYTEVRHADMIEHRRLRVDTRKWFASKLNKKLADRVQAEHSGPDGMPIPVSMTLPDFDFAAFRKKVKERANARSGGN